MARPVRITRKRILEAALDIVRSGGPGGDIGSYSGVEAVLMGQNHLLQQLHAAPRYIRDTEWNELERVLRNNDGITPQTLRQAHPGLTPGDIRIFILDCLQFSVAEQAIMLGIAAHSVTKARQRLKVKMAAAAFLGMSHHA